MTDFATRRRMMVDTQVRPSDVTKYPIIDALLSIPREVFVPAATREAAYVDDLIKLPDGRYVLDPRSLAKMLDVLNIQPGDVVLDLGCGLGYSAAVIAHMAQAVVAVEAEAEMAEEAQALLSGEDIDNAAVIAGPLEAGAAKHGPYDVITIEGGVEQVPQAVLDQLREGGRIAAIFMDGALGECRIGQKIDGSVDWRMAFNAAAPVLSGFEKARAFAL